MQPSPIEKGWTEQYCYQRFAGSHAKKMQLWEEWGEKLLAVGLGFGICSPQVLLMTVSVPHCMSSVRVQKVDPSNSQNNVSS